MHDFITIFLKLIIGSGTTLEIIAFSLLFSLLLSLLLLLVRKIAGVGKGIYAFYIEIMRASPIPIVVMIFFFTGKAVLKYFGIDSSNIQDLWYGVAAISMISGAYFAEALRAGLNAINLGQFESIAACNIPPVVGFFRIILPQVFIIAIPNLGNAMITIVKMTAVVNMVGINDVFGLAKRISNASYGILQIPAFISTLLVYWLISTLMVTLLRVIENKYRVILDK